MSCCKLVYIFHTLVTYCKILDICFWRSSNETSGGSFSPPFEENVVMSLQQFFISILEKDTRGEAMTDTLWDRE